MWAGYSHVPMWALGLPVQNGIHIKSVKKLQRERRMKRRSRWDIKA
jgi:hypothetical protein